jgi:hypothetical protein
MGILQKYNDIVREIKFIDADINFYKKLLKLQDMSHLEYYKQVKFEGEKYVNTVYSVVEKEVMTKETVHIVNKKIVEELLGQAELAIIIKNKQLDDIETALKSINKEDEYILRCKYLEYGKRRMTFEDIEKNFEKEFKKHLTRQSIIKRAKKAERIIDKLVKPIIKSDFLSNINWDYVLE